MAMKIIVVLFLFSLIMATDSVIAINRKILAVKVATESDVVNVVKRGGSRTDSANDQTEEKLFGTEMEPDINNHHSIPRESWGNSHG